MLLTSKMPTVNEYIVCTDTVYVCLSKPKSAYPVSMNVYGTKVLTQQLFTLVCNRCINEYIAVSDVKHGTLDSGIDVPP